MAAATTTSKRFNKFVAELHAGDYDERLRELNDEAHERHRILRNAATLEAASRLRRKMRVRVKPDANLSPKYMLGQVLGPIKTINSTRAVVELERPVGRFVGSELTVPLDALEEVK